MAKKGVLGFDQKHGHCLKEMAEFVEAPSSAVSFVLLQKLEYNQSVGETLDKNIIWKIRIADNMRGWLLKTFSGNTMTVNPV